MCVCAMLFQRIFTYLHLMFEVFMYCRDNSIPIELYTSKYNGIPEAEAKRRDITHQALPPKVWLKCRCLALLDSIIIMYLLIKYVL